jgi:hypothetical protein
MEDEGTKHQHSINGSIAAYGPVSTPVIIAESLVLFFLSILTET